MSDLAVEVLLPLAAEGLASWGIDAQTARHHLAVIDGRLRARRTGATWQTEVVARLEARGHSRAAALRAMLQRYLDHGATGAPVHTWPTG